VADIGVAMHARKHFATVRSRQHLVDRGRVAMQASALCNAPIPRLDLNRFVKILESERERVEKTVISLRDPLEYRMMRQMAIVANGYVSMA
jgi:hypothetical protein